jgi:hypothetical protein
MTFKGELCHPVILASTEYGIRLLTMHSCVRRPSVEKRTQQRQS